MSPLHAVDMCHWNGIKSALQMAVSIVTAFSEDETQNVFSRKSDPQDARDTDLQVIWTPIVSDTFFLQIVPPTDRAALCVAYRVSEYCILGGPFRANEVEGENGINYSPPFCTILQ